MAASAWAFYNDFKRYMADGTIDLDTTAFQMHLFQSSSNAATATLSTLGSLTNQVASANGYTLSGKTMAKTWSTGASASEMRWDDTARIWSASGGSISAIKFAVIVAQTGASAKDAANKLVAQGQLSTSQFSVTTGNTLTITPSANGIFELN
jgi:hypothetical protein